MRDRLWRYSDRKTASKNVHLGLPSLGLMECIRLTLEQDFAGGVQRTPTFLWSPESYVKAGSEGQKSRVSYETASTLSVAEVLLGSFFREDGVHSAAQHLLNAEDVKLRAPETLLLYVGNQVHPESLAEPSLADVLQPLRRAVENAGSSLSMPNIVHKGPGSVSELISQQLQFQSGPASLQMLGACSGGGDVATEASASAVQSLLSQAAGTAQVVMVCPSEAGLREEMDLLEQIQAVLAEGDRRHVMAYISDPAYNAQASLPARHLLSEQQPHTNAAKTYVCDAKCETQVKLLEAVILAITLITALMTGSWMLNNLGTPTRFETPKDSLRQE
ncbi:g7146 [Coccomyxa elongata]